MSSTEEIHEDVSSRLQLNASTPWQDVTELLAVAANELKTGQLVHMDNFNLFDSMSALELMDPKMDSGMLVNGEPPQSIADRMKNGSIALEFTSARDVLATIDELFRCEAGWLDGQPLAQTLFTCVYMHREPLNALLSQIWSFDMLTMDAASLHDALTAKFGNSAKETLLLVMGTVCLVGIKTCTLLRDAVVRADIYEEEDFSSSNTLDLGILEALPKQMIDTLLQVTEERLERGLVEQKAAASKKQSKKKTQKKSPAAEGSGSTGLESLYPNPRIGSLICEALFQRVRLRKTIFEAYSKLGLADHHVELGQVRAQFEQCKDILTAISTEQLEMDPEVFSGKPIGFDKLISRLLLSGSPPRDVKLLSMDETLEFQKRLVASMITACSPPEWTGMEELRIFLADYSRQNFNIVARSYVLLLLYSEQKIYGKHSFTDWLSNAMVMNGVPLVLLSTQEGVLFSSRSIETLYESLKVYLLHRSRQRARIEYLLEEWSALQAEAVAVDEKFITEMSIPKASYPRYFTAWTLEETVLLMIQHVSLGLDLELYSTAEHGMIYWYLDYLHGSRLQNLSYTWSFVEKMKQMMPPNSRGHRSSSSDSAPTPPPAPTPPAPSAESKPSNKKSKHKKKQQAAPAPVEVAPPVVEADPTKARFMREIKFSEMQRNAMRAYFQLFSALEREGLVQAVVPKYGSAKTRFEHRFAAFQSINFPAPLSFEDFSKNSDFSPYQVELIYQSADECFKVMCTHGEQMLRDEQAAILWLHAPEITPMIKVSIANGVALARRELPVSSSKADKKGAKSSAGGTASPMSLELDYSVHPHFPVVSLPERKSP